MAMTSLHPLQKTPSSSDEAAS
jgi:hypothetical protein